MFEVCHQMRNSRALGIIPDGSKACDVPHANTAPSWPNRMTPGAGLGNGLQKNSGGAVCAELSVK